MDDATLIVPDLHQDIDFLIAVGRMVRERSPARVVFLGDYFDTDDPELQDPMLFRKFCHELGELQGRLGPRGVFLWGNHDLPYYLARYRFDAGAPVPPDGIIGELRQFSWAAAGVIEEVLGKDFWARLEIAEVSHGHLLSHAGVHRGHCAAPDPVSARSQLCAEWRELLGEFKRGYDGRLRWMVAPGLARGGTESHGGPLWLDWRREFEDIPGLPQIVGHSRGPSVRTRGASTCLDCGQTVCAVLTAQGLEVVRA